LGKPCFQPLEFCENNVDFTIAGGVNLHPVDAVPRGIGLVIANGVVPAVGVGFVRLKRTVYVYASAQTPRIRRLDVRAILSPKRPKTTSPSVVQMRGLFNGSPETHRISSICALAVALATALLTLPLNSESPPHPPLPASSSEGSNSEMSLVCLVFGSK